MLFFVYREAKLKEEAAEAERLESERLEEERSRNENLEEQELGRRYSGLDAGSEESEEGCIPEENEQE